MFDEAWIEVERDPKDGRLQRVWVCDKHGNRIDLPITKFTVSASAKNLGTASFSVYHGRVKYI